MSEIVWGADIQVDRKMPGWLKADDTVWCINGFGEWLTTNMGNSTPLDKWNWPCITAIRLPADHRHYKQDEPLCERTVRACAGSLRTLGFTYSAEAVEALIPQPDPDVGVLRSILMEWHLGAVEPEDLDPAGFARALAAYKATKGGEG